MKVNKKVAAYPVALAVAMAMGTAHAQSVTPATLTAEGQTITAGGRTGDIYSLQGHAARAAVTASAAEDAKNAQRLPLMSIVLADDYALNDEILLKISGTGVTPNIQKTLTTAALDKGTGIVCTTTDNKNFVIGHPDQYIEQSAPYQTLRLRVTQKDQTVTSTVGATCRIEGIYITDESIAGATLTANSLTAEAVIFANWTAYDDPYVIGGSGPPNNNNIIDELEGGAAVAIAKVMNQFSVYNVTREWDGVIDVQVAGSQYTRFMRNSPGSDSDQTQLDVSYAATDLLVFTTVDRGSGPVATNAAVNVYGGAGQQNFFDGAVAEARFELDIAGDFNFVRDTSAQSCGTAGVVSGGSSSVAGTSNGNGTSATSASSDCSILTYSYDRGAGVYDGTTAATTITHNVTATRGVATSPWFVRQDFPISAGEWVVLGHSSVGSQGTSGGLTGADDVHPVDTNDVDGTGTTPAVSAGTDDPGAWTINGTRVFVPYLPFDTGITRILRVSNIMFTDGDRQGDNVSIFNTTDNGGTNETNATFTGALPDGVGKSGTDSRVGRTTWNAGTQIEDGATVLYQVWNADGNTCTFDGTVKAKANATTNLATDFRNGVTACSGILTAGAGTVSAMITIGAPEQGIEVVSAYNVNGDRVQVINNSNGRNNSESNAELGSRRPSGRSDYKQSEDLDDSQP